MTTEPYLSGAQARTFLGGLKGRKQLSHNALVALVQQEGLPKHSDPFGTGRWVFLRSELEKWYSSRIGAGVTVLRPSGRPRRCATGGAR